MIWSRSTHLKARTTLTPWLPAGKSQALRVSSQWHRANGADFNSVNSFPLFVYKKMNSSRKFLCGGVLNVNWVITYLFRGNNEGEG